MSVLSVDMNDAETQLVFKVGDVPKTPFLDDLLQGEIVGVPAPVLERIENDALCFRELLQVLRLGIRSGDGLVHEHYARTPRLFERKRVRRRCPPCFPASRALCGVVVIIRSSVISE